ncbi:hypothetical protein SOVF_144410 isoform A [Spinacia oleracea]|nr:hypothetical protein SOVF_144410 isoform A [Spinacia oleracea]
MSELQGRIALYRLTRLYVDYICWVLFDQAVTIMPVSNRYFPPCYLIYLMITDNALMTEGRL